MQVRSAIQSQQAIHPRSPSWGAGKPRARCGFAGRARASQDAQHSAEQRDGEPAFFAATNVRLQQQRELLKQAGLPGGRDAVSCCDGSRGAGA
jgi:hypothetical protein